MLGKAICSQGRYKSTTHQLKRNSIYQLYNLIRCDKEVQVFNRNYRLRIRVPMRHYSKVTLTIISLFKYCLSSNWNITVFFGRVQIVSRHFHCGGEGEETGGGGLDSLLPWFSSILDSLWNPGFWSMHVFNYHHFVNDISPLQENKIEMTLNWAQPQITHVVAVTSFKTHDSVLFSIKQNHFTGIWMLEWMLAIFVNNSTLATYRIQLKAFHHSQFLKGSVFAKKIASHVTLTCGQLIAFNENCTT